MDSITRSVRHALFTFWLEHCRPPTVDELASASCKDAAVTRKALTDLQDKHHIVLYDDHLCTPSPVAMAHPFSHLPTTFSVHQGSRSWWTNCAWCGFGLASMLAPEEVILKARSGSIGKEMTFLISGDQILCNGSEEEGKNCRIHFSIPPSRWWDNVRLACGTIQLFASEAEAREWPEKYGFRKGAYMDLATLWELSKVWYHDKHRYEYERKTSEEVRKIYSELGMSSPYWST
ncbi:hypothetical protein FQN57_002551 [Myotisia sp. PD_48]|nr:hypothetical protein FQN57_002551 [Myotisia sp. PD_48]